MKQLERLWPEGPMFTYRATMDLLLDYADGTVCPCKQADAPKCHELRLATIGLLRAEMAELNARRGGPDRSVPMTSWLLTSMAVNMFCCIFLDGVR
jgi:hypothetical protein